MCKQFLQIPTLNRVWLHFSRISFIALTFTLLTQGHYCYAISVKPVNNNEIAIPPFEDNNVNNYYDLERQILMESYKRKDGHIRDEFITNQNAEKHIASLPHGRKDTIYHKEIEKIRKEQLNDSNQGFNEYFIMRKRVLAPTMRR